MVKGKQVLIVDDDPQILDTLGELLPNDITVHKAKSEEKALQIIESQELDAVICDISLGTGNGLKLLQTCRMRKISVPFVMITGDATKENAIQAFRLGAADILEKPVSIEYFEHKFRRVVDEGFSLRRIRDGANQVASALGSKPDAKDTDFVRDYLAMVEANRLLKKAS